MRFKDAQKRLAAIAQGNAMSLSYEIMTHSHGKQVQSCYVWIMGYDGQSAPTWGEALAAIKAEIDGGRRVVVENITELGEK